MCTQFNLLTALKVHNWRIKYYLEMFTKEQETTWVLQNKFSENNENDANKEVGIFICVVIR